LLLDHERAKLQEFVDSIHYSARYVHLHREKKKGEKTKKEGIDDYCAEKFLDRYSDNEYEYRHVQLPKNMLKIIPPDYFDSSKGTLKLLWEDEWRGLGITQVCTGGPTFFSSFFSLVILTRTCQSLGWEHYEVHEPEPHILLFK
jgi:cyclin-dependent kinase regulatory subunit CKS1